MIFHPVFGGSSKLNFTFDGSMTPVVYDDEGNWEFSILDTGNLVFKSDPGRIDVFLVGGGAGGAVGSNASGTGGGGGYTKNVFGIPVTKNQSYPIVIGAGGGVDANGGNTTAFGYIAGGGTRGSSGGHGGSGGGGWGEEYGGNGGSDGYNGADGQDVGGDENDYSLGGTGQRNYAASGETTTRAFREPNGLLTSGAGGGYGYQTSGTGGPGGGGNVGVKGTTNLGGGGGAGAAGGSGRVIIRNVR